MKKPKAKTRTVLDYHQCTKFIEKKYKIDVRDYAHSNKQFDEWCKAKGIKPDGNSQSQWSAFKKAIKNGELIERPYQDFWHWIIDVCPVSNGGTIHLSAELGDGAIPWQKEILALYVKEFGDNQEYETSW